MPRRPLFRDPVTPPAGRTPERRRWQWKAVYRSRTLHILAVGAIAWGLSTAGVAQELANIEAQRVVEVLLQLIEGGAYLVAAVNRTRNAHSHLALTQKRADEKNAAIAAVLPPAPVVPPTKE